MVSCGMESLVETFIFPSSSVAIVCGELLYDSTLNVVPNASMSRVAVFTMKGLFLSRDTLKLASQNGKQYGGNGFIDSAAEVGPFSRQKVVSMECF